MSNSAHIRPDAENVPQPPEGAMQAFAPAPVPTMIKADSPAGADFVVLIVSTPQTPQQFFFLDKATARKLGRDMQELGSKATIQIAQAMPQTSGLVLP